MAVQPQIVPQSGEQPAKKRRNRSPSVAKPAYFIIQVLDESGQPMAFDKTRIRLVSVERNTDKVLEYVEGDRSQHIFYIRGIVPVARQSAPRSAPQAA